VRRLSSVLFFVLGGWIFMVEPLAAFFNFVPGHSLAVPFMMAFCLVLAAIPLGIATALSPGQRWRELGLTILLSTGAAALGGGSAIVMFNDPAFEAVAPPMPELGFAPLIGTLNLIAVIAVGVLLYRRAGQAVDG
jgi:hypothetical protein